MTDAPLVLVTGISGFVGSWVGYAALKVGYRVRGTVRDLSNVEKTKHLQNLCPGSRYKLELVEADLSVDGGWERAITGATYVLHVASPFPLTEPDDPQELIRPSVEGTIRILQAAARLTNGPKRIVMTSSAVAMFEGQNKESYSDDDWANPDIAKLPVSAYAKSKVLAEKAAWEFVESLPESKRFEFVSINPTMIFGPMLSSSNCTSVELVGNIITGKTPFLPSVKFGCVSVYDVVRAHLLAMTIPEAANKRFLLDGYSSGVRMTAKKISDEFLQYGYSPTRWNLPTTIVNVLAFFGNVKAKTSLPYLGRPWILDCANARNILKMTFKEEFCIEREMVLAGIHVGLIPDLSEDQMLSRNYQRPEFDLSMIPPAQAVTNESNLCK